MVTQDEINSFMCGVRENIRINLEKDAELLDVAADALYSRLFDKFNLPDVANLMPLHLRYEAAWDRLVAEIIPEMQKLKINKSFNIEVDVASIENMVDDTNSVRKLDTTGLPNFNYIKLFEHLLFSPAYYREAIFQTALQSLAGIVLKVPYAHTRDIFGNQFEEPLYTNIYTLCLLKAGASKTTIYRTGRRMVKITRTDDVFTPVSPSPELLKKKLATEYVEVRPNRKTEKMEEKHFSYAGKEKYAGWRVIWDEECSMYWEQFGKGYMSGSVPLLCSLFSCIYEGKGNVNDDGGTSEYLCEDPYLSVNMYTTPVNMRLLNVFHILNGFIPRHAIMIGEYYTPLPETSGNGVNLDEAIDMFHDSGIAKAKNIEVEKRKWAVEKASRIIADVLDPSKYKDGKFEVQFHETCFQLIIDWEINMRNSVRNNPTLSVLRGRQFEICYKLAILFTIGNIPYYLLCKDNYAGEISHNCAFEDIKDLDAFVERLAYFNKEKIMAYKLKRLVVPPDAMRFALKLMDEIYFPHAIKATEKMMVDYEDEDTEKVIGLFEKSEKITKAELIDKKDGVKKGYEMIYLERIKGKDEDGIDVAIKVAEMHAEKMIDMISEFSDDCELTYITQTKLYDSARRHFKRVERVLESLIKCNNIIPIRDTFGKSKKPTTAYVYVRGSRATHEMPPNNYVGYTGNGRYYAGVEFEKIEGKPETEEVKEPSYSTKENVAAKLAGFPVSVVKPIDSDDIDDDDW